MREQGFAVAVDELEVGLTAVGGADPQRARRRHRLDERLGPTFRLDDERIDERRSPAAGRGRTRCRTGLGGATDDGRRPLVGVLGAVGT